MEKLVATVPERIWSEGRPPSAETWEAEFNVASWVRIRGGNSEMQLLVCHSDASGEQRALVDRVLLDGDGSALMSGMVRLRFQGDVKEVEIRLRVSEPGLEYKVDELFFQRRGSVLAGQEKLISNF